MTGTWKGLVLDEKQQVLRSHFLRVSDPEAERGPSGLFSQSVVGGG